MASFRRPRRAAVVAVAAVVLGTFLTGYAVGRSTGWIGEPATRSGEASGVVTPEPEAGTAGPDAGADAESDAEVESDADVDSDADVAAAAEPAALAQPVTGPGRPPLPMNGQGPFGSRRTTGAEFAALTFDDGPDPRFTPRILALLREHRVTATFCVVGQLARAYPDLIREIAADGHTLCNHSWDHDVGLGSRPESRIRRDLERTNQAIYAAEPAARVSYYRQPGGAWTDRVVAVAAELGMSSLHWAVDPVDWSQPGAGAIADTVRAGTGKGAIVLLHDGGGERSGTVRALGRVLTDLTDRVTFAALPPGVDPPHRHGRELPLRPGQI